jgi:hypothetical protein
VWFLNKCCRQSSFQNSKPKTSLFSSSCSVRGRFFPRAEDSSSAWSVVDYSDCQLDFVEKKIGGGTIFLPQSDRRRFPRLRKGTQKSTLLDSVSSVLISILQFFIGHRRQWDWSQGCLLFAFICEGKPLGSRRKGSGSHNLHRYEWTNSRWLS